MESIEVRYRRKILLPFLAVLALFLIGGLCYIFFSGLLYTKAIYWTVPSIVLSVPLAYMIYTRGKSALKK